MKFRAKTNSDNESSSVPDVDESKTTETAANKVIINIIVLLIYCIIINLN